MRSNVGEAGMPSEDGTRTPEEVGEGSVPVQHEVACRHTCTGAVEVPEVAAGADGSPSSDCSCCCYC